MRTYLVRVMYSSGSWARMFQNPGDCSIVGVRTGALTTTEGHQLLTEEELDDALALAKSASQAYRPPPASGRP